MRNYQTQELAARDGRAEAGPVWRAARIVKVSLAVALLAGVAGCVGYVDSGGYVEGGYVAPPVVVTGPDVYLYGGYERGHEVHDYSHRGFESRAVVHPSIRLPSPPHLPTPSHPFGGGRR